MPDRIFLRGIRVRGHHGVMEEEKALGQMFLIDLDAWLDTREYAALDDVTLAVGYDAMFEVVRRVTEGERFDLIEALAAGIATALLESFPALDAVRVEVHKPSAPIPGIFDDVGVEITRRRGEG